MSSSDLISTAYLEEQRLLHATGEYGKKGKRWCDKVRLLSETYHCTTILDYGCGQGTLKKGLKDLDIREYDPAIPGKDGMPTAADLVVITDVLEHIEEDKIGAVIAHLRLLTNKKLFAIASTRPAVKFLSDGRNAHILLRDADWWREIFRKNKFTFVEDALTNDRQWVAVLSPRN